MLRKILTVFATLTSLHAAIAAETYPAHPITLVSPYAIGSDTDVSAHLLGSLALPLLNAPSIHYEARPGASGALATSYVRSALPDGYTLLIGRTGSQIITPAMAVVAPYGLNDFTTLAILSSNPLICVVRAGAPYKTIRELVAGIRDAPGKISYSTAGPSSAQNIAAQYLLALSGLKPDAAQAKHLESAGQATTALLNGDVDFICNNTNTLIPHITSGQLRGLFTTASGRLSALPDLPNAREVGLRDMAQIQSWTALIGPAKLPEEVKEKWKGVLAKLARDPHWLQGNIEMGGQSALLIIKNPDQFIHDQYLFYEQLVTKLGLRQ